mmetsp:Transcript_4639/g.8600  ORF Transcript_4639/g.8600 Transcript_4639/m.8600 type:complete len:204 (+) Transcript_4639:724-1335(+)
MSCQLNKMTSHTSTRAQDQNSFVGTNVIADANGWGGTCQHRGTFWCDFVRIQNLIADYRADSSVFCHGVSGSYCEPGSHHVSLLKIGLSRHGFHDNTTAISTGHVGEGWRALEDSCLSRHDATISRCQGDGQHLENHVRLAVFFRRGPDEWVDRFGGLIGIIETRDGHVVTNCQHFFHRFAVRLHLNGFHCLWKFLGKNHGHT